jgi:hypothetical protein
MITETSRPIGDKALRHKQSLRDHGRVPRPLNTYKTEISAFHTPAACPGASRPARAGRRADEAPASPVRVVDRAAGRGGPETLGGPWGRIPAKDRCKRLVIPMTNVCQQCRRLAERGAFRGRYLSVIGERRSGTGWARPLMENAGRTRELTGPFRMMIVEFSSMIIAGGGRGRGRDHPGGVRDT